MLGKIKNTNIFKMSSAENFNKSAKRYFVEIITGHNNLPYLVINVFYGVGMREIYLDAMPRKRQIVECSLCGKKNDF